MTTAIDTTALTSARPDDVWRHLTDWSSASSWMGDVTDVREPADEPGTLRFRARGRERSSRIEVREPPRRLVLTSVVGPVRAAYAYTLTPDPSGGTRVRLVADVAVRGPLTVLAPLLRRSIAREDGAQVERLRALVDHHEAHRG